MRLAEFIRKERERILSEWDAFAKTRLPAAEYMSVTALRDHAEELLEAIAADMDEPQTDTEQSQKSRGKRRGHHAIDVVGGEHARLRLEEGFSIGQLLSEYRALRASVIRLWVDSFPEAVTSPSDLYELTRFNEAVDQTLAESVACYTARVNTYREQFIGMLGHDLRNPLSAIVTSASFLVRAGELDDRRTRSASRILESAARMNRMVGDLLDLTKSRLGTGIRISVAEVEIGALVRGVIDELQVAHLDQGIELEETGALVGRWDGDRLEQALSNLIANAIQHGREKAPIVVRLRAEDHDVFIEVHNEGDPISPRAQANLFEPMVQGTAPESRRKPPGSLGLGLFIVREIMTAHGGEVTVRSSEEEGTTFTLRLPREGVEASSTSAAPAAPRGSSRARPV